MAKETKKTAAKGKSKGTKTAKGKGGSKGKAGC